ncbi:hypothetical protein NPIL_240211 [Nephila pilipes]|uniref:Uncharacterized protein n=1 Tax=Nephila pilipes TaxID=299642 RepID=A0A8X6IKI3_NEPPI|nr:hypothetical protein NPIL_240211 [Nephila pilipes]
MQKNTAFKKKRCSLCAFFSRSGSCSVQWSEKYQEVNDICKRQLIGRGYKIAFEAYKRQYKKCFHLMAPKARMRWKVEAFHSNVGKSFGGNNNHSRIMSGK